LDVDEKNSLEVEKGVKGMFPLGCILLWGREGINIIAFPRE
jgi:hypothetical protein